MDYFRLRPYASKIAKPAKQFHPNDVAYFTARVVSLTLKSESQGHFPGRRL